MTPARSGRPKLGGAFTKATPFDGLRVLAPGEPNAPAPAPPLRSVPDGSIEPDEATDQVTGDTAGSAADDQETVADEAPGAIDERGSAAPPQPDAAPDDDDDDGAAPTSFGRPKNSTAKRTPRARATSDSTANPTPSNGAATQSTTKLVPVNVDASVHNQLRQFAARVELPFSVVVLRAIEAGAAELAVAWKTSPTPRSGGMFQMVDHRTRNRRTEPFAQIQLRLTTADAEVLESLIRDWGAPSRSALVNEALRRYVMAADT
jgi:hypothetical protein